MKKILWISRNTPTDSQIKELKRLFGSDCQVDQDTSPFSSADDIVRRFKRGHYDDMVVIAPISVCKVLVDLGYKPLYSEMIRATPEHYEVAVQGTQDRINGTRRYYNFVRFKRLEKVDMVFSDLAIDK